MIPPVLFGLLVLASLGLAGAEGLAGTEPSDPKDAKGRALRDLSEAYSADSLRIARLHQESERAKSRWIEAVRLTGDSGACVLFHRATNGCQATVGDFNANVAGLLSHKMTGAAPAPDTIKSLRKEILDFLSAEAFRRRADNPYIARAEAEADRAGDLALPEGVDSLFLARLYREDLVSLVRAQNRMSFDIYASTDSGLIDSLGRGTAGQRAWAAARFPAREVAEEWIRSATSLTPREWGPIVRTAFGWARVRIDRKPPTFRESLPLLIRFAAFKLNAPVRDWDSLATARLGRARASRQGKIPVRVAARLLPRPRGVSGLSGGSRRRREDSLLAQAAVGFPMKELAWEALPVSVRAQASRPASEPFLSEYGFWWIDSIRFQPAPGPVPTPSERRALETEMRRNESDSLMFLASRIGESKSRDKMERYAENAWRQDLRKEIRSGTPSSVDGKAFAEDWDRVEAEMARIRAAWIAANLEIPAEFR